MTIESKYNCFKIHFFYFQIVKLIELSATKYQKIYFYQIYTQAL